MHDTEYSPDGESVSLLIHTEGGGGTGQEWELGRDEGKISVDVADAGDSLVIVAVMAGAQPDRTEVNIQGDLLTIRGFCRPPLGEGQNMAAYFYQECSWGPCSRTIVLPTEVNSHRARAEYRNGVLTVTVPKRSGDARIPVIVVEE